uniref:Uncharacterized protein n=1 Tax=Oncorhynchus tshawytscha TaxID=74940 RepID=A0AAZ3S321_ONCTS
METEAKEGHQSYIHSHNAYFVSEQVDRKYKGSRYGKDGRFGVPIPLHNDGRSVSKSLHWLCDTQKLALILPYIYSKHSTSHRSSPFNVTQCIANSHDIKC